MDIKERTPIWIALSNFYLDTELQDYNFKHIASVIKASPYSLEEVKQIDKEEVFPVLYVNLLSVAGIWSGFQEDWLVEEITKKLKNKTWISSLIASINYRRLRWMCKDYWAKLEEAYQQF